MELNEGTGELGYDGPLYDGFSHMTDDMLGPSPMHNKYLSYVYDGFPYDRPIFLVPLSLSYPGSPVLANTGNCPSKRTVPNGCDLMSHHPLINLTQRTWYYI